MSRVDIVIIGAGAAGLEAARELNARGHSLLLLEARDRIGGRVLTHRDPRVPLPIELGAEFIHGAAPVTEDLLLRAGLSALDVAARQGSLHRGKLDRIEYWPAVDRVLRRIDTEGPDESIADFLARRPGGHGLARERGVALRFVEGFHAADPKQISAQSIAPDPGESPSDSTSRLGRVTQGYGSLMEWLARDLGTSLRTGCEVKSIAWQRGHATVEARLASGRALRCAARVVLVTVPVGVLRAPAHAAGVIGFDPDPARLRKALASYGVGSVLRVVFWFRELPWAGKRGDERFNFLNLPEGPSQVLWTAHPARWPLAIMWCGGPAAAELSREPRSAVLRALLNQLARDLGTTSGRLKSAVHRVWWHNWARDPYARGAYTYRRIDAAHAGRILAMPEQGTLFFAGEATDARGGTVEAALASGRRAARQVVLALGRR